MKIPLDEKHWLNSDEHCYWVTVLVEPDKDSRKRKPYERVVSGYVPTFEMAVDSFIDKYVGKTTATSLNKLANDIRKLKREVRAWKDVKV